jgi:excisionase family DNA binding protein
MKPNMRNQKSKRAADERATYRIPEAAKVAGVGSGAIRRAIAAGVIPAVRFGRITRVPKAPFHRFLDSGGQAA